MILGNEMTAFESLDIVKGEMLPSEWYSSPMCSCERHSMVMMYLLTQEQVFCDHEEMYVQRILHFHVYKSIISA